MAKHDYAVERLYEDQERDFVIDVVPAMLAWLADGRGRDDQVSFDVDVAMDSGTKARSVAETLALSWDRRALAQRDPGLGGRIRRLRSARSPHREHATEVAAYGLALVAISVFQPGRRVIAWAKYVAPDLLFDATPSARRGVEVAGRSSGGRAALTKIRGRPGDAGKDRALRADPEIAEAWLSLWSGAPRVGTMVKVKP